MQIVIYFHLAYLFSVFAILIYDINCVERVVFLLVFSYKCEIYGKILKMK